MVTKTAHASNRSILLPVKSGRQEERKIDEHEIIIYTRTNEFA